MKKLLENNSLILMEAAIVEPLRRSQHISLHPVLVNALLIYDQAGRDALSHLYQKYIDIARKSQRPFLMCTPTWRATQSPELFSRLVGYLANASSLDHCDLDGAEELLMENVSEWGELMLDLNRTQGVKILGGCCGTNEEHLNYLVSDPS